MSEAIRTERTFGVTSKLTPQQRGALAQVRHHAGYQVLLDVIEMVCIEQESRLINRDVTEPDKIVAEHRKTQAIWQMFTHLQEIVDREVGAYASATSTPAPADHYTPEELEIDELLDPTRHRSLQAAP